MSISASEKSELQNTKSVVFTKDGRLVWRSPRWLGRHDPQAEKRLLGSKWHEFVMLDDLPRVLEWFGSDEPGIAFCCIDPETGQAARVGWAKVPYGDKHWLVVGDAIECLKCDPCDRELLPAPPCIVGDIGSPPGDYWGGRSL
jgi:hypothetical protein